MVKKEIGSPTLMGKVRLDDTDGKELPEVKIYAFDQFGRFITSATLPKVGHGEVKLELPPELSDATVGLAGFSPLGTVRGGIIPPVIDKAVRERRGLRVGPVLRLGSKLISWRCPGRSSYVC